jgi:hypothetical protein
MDHTICYRDYSLSPHDLLPPDRVTRRHAKGWRLEDRPTHISMVGRYFVKQGPDGLYAEDEDGKIQPWLPLRCTTAVRLRCGCVSTPGDIIIQDVPGIGELFSRGCFVRELEEAHGD